MDAKGMLQRTALNAARTLGLLPPERVLRGMKNRGVRVETLSGLELFAGDGSQTLVLFAKHLKNLEVWEFNPKLESRLRLKVPDARVRIVDSYHQIRETPDKFDWVSADSWTGMTPGREYCENFELFPSVFRLFKPRAYLILNLLPELNVGRLQSSGYEFLDQHLQRRRDFYRWDNPEKIPIEHMVRIYEELITSNGYRLDWWFSVERTLVNLVRRQTLYKRWSFYYLALALKNQVVG